MSGSLTLPIDDLTLARIDALATAREMSRESFVRRVIDERLVDEEYALEQIRAGMAEAARGEYASAEDVEAVFTRYRPA